MNIDYTPNISTISLPCPIHNGDNLRGVSINVSNLYWNCWTRQCHEKYGRGIFGFVKGCLENQGNRQYSDSEVKNWLGGIQTSNYTPIQTIEKPDTYYSKFHYASSVKCPSKYFMERGYKKAILDKYMVGTSWNETSIMYRRAMVPIFDVANRIVGFQGRSVDKQCEYCEQYHSPYIGCKLYQPKWLIIKNFNKNKHLYNINYAAPYIANTKKVILFEGCCDVWKLEESNIHNSVALFGTSLSTKHTAVLRALGTSTVYIATNNDIAGIKAKSILYDKLISHFKVKSINIPSKDLEPLDTKTIKNIFGEAKCRK